ncbi:MAG TPA: NAD(P)-binding domain-containing protein, partial [Jatrophihabitans sp.]
MSEAAPRLRVGIVGVGRVGSVVGAALARAGHEIVGVSAVSDASLRRAAKMLPGAQVRPVDEVVAAADFVLLAVPDDVLRLLVAGLAD